jgi:hypothetical protein
LFNIFTHILKNVIILSKEIILLLNYSYKLLVDFLENSPYDNNERGQLKILYWKVKIIFILKQNFIPNETLILKQKEYNKT